MRHGPLLHLHLRLHLQLHVRTLTSSLTEARKQAQAEAAYYGTFEQQQDASDKRHDSKASANPPDSSASEPESRIADRTPRSASPANNLTALIARIATKRRGSDDSLKTTYTADDAVPASAYRSRPDVRSDLSVQQAALAIAVPTNNSVNEDDPLASLADS